MKRFKLSLNNIDKRSIIIVDTFKCLFKKRKRSIMIIQFKIKKFHNDKTFLKTNKKTKTTELK